MKPGPCEHCGSPDRSRQCRYSWYLPYREDWKKSGADAPCYCDDYAESEMRADGSLGRKILLGLLLLVVVICGCFWLTRAKAQDHHSHPPQDMAIHEKFYSTWMMPNNRSVSCCHNEDCSPAESKFENGQWLARKVGDDGEFTPIPPERIERDRDSPDGRSHLCGRRYGFNSGGMTVFCFAPGIGG